jgi:hypothetical protein
MDASALVFMRKKLAAGFYEAYIMVSGSLLAGVAGSEAVTRRTCRISRRRR